MIPPLPTVEPDRKSLGPSIIDGKLRYLSVSQLEAYDPDVFGGCPRRWYFRYVKRIKEPQKKSQKLGTQVHSQIEHYLKTGEDVLGDIARSGKRFLPEPGSDLLIEHSVHDDVTDETAPIVSGLVSADVPFVGYIDVLHKRGAWVNDDGSKTVELNTAEALDWKTTVKIEDDVDDQTGIVVKKGYAKSADELASGWQMLGYGEYASQKFPHIRAVALSHGVFQTDTKKAKLAKKTSKLVTVAEITTAWRRSEAVVERIKGTASTAEVASVPANLKSCSSYGGCPHQAICPRDPKKVLQTLYRPIDKPKERPTMSLLAKMKTTAAAAPTQVSAPIASAAASYAAKSEPPLTHETAAIARERAALLAEEAAVKAPAVVAPDAPAPNNIAVPIPSEAAAPTVPVAATVPVEIKVKKTRAKKSSPVQVGPTIVLKQGETSDVQTLTEDENAGFSLYINGATEDGVPLVVLDHYINDLHSNFCAQHGIPDIRNVDNDHALGYGRARGAFAAYVRTNPPAPGRYAARTRDHELAALVVPELIPLADRVLRGAY